MTIFETIQTFIWIGQVYFTLLHIETFPETLRACELYGLDFMSASSGLLLTDFNCWMLGSISERKSCLQTNFVHHVFP